MVTVNIVKNSYKDGSCPDCGDNIPDDVDTGDACSNCGHAFYASVDWRHDANKGKTEEVCDECGSTNIGYDAWVKRINGELEVVAGPYDRCQCLNDVCLENEPHVRSVPVESLRYCDGKDCYYQGDKDVMTSKPASSQGNTGIRQNWAYWFCSRCIKEANGPNEVYHKNEEMK